VQHRAHKGQIEAFIRKWQVLSWSGLEDPNRKALTRPYVGERLSDRRNQPDQLSIRASTLLHSISR